MRAVLLMAALWACAPWGCGAPWPAVLSSADVATLPEGTPRISRVRDLGDVPIGQAGPLLARSDGLFTVGELILIEGRGFGRRPTVLLAQRPAAVLRRSAGGGIIARLPTGTAAGVQQLVVRGRGGAAQATVRLRRLGLVSDRYRGQVHTLELGTIGPLEQPALRPVAQPLEITDPRQVAMSPDGAAAYVLAGDAQVAVVDLCAPGGPQVAGTRAARHRVGQLVAAARAPVLALLGDRELTLWDLREAVRPVPLRLAPLPAGTVGYTMGALDLTGTLLALGLPEGNRVVVLDLTPQRDEGRPRIVDQIAVLPGARQQLLIDLRFSPDGRTLWVLSGDHQRSVGLGHQPTRLSAVRLAWDRALGPQQPALALLRTVELPEVGAPLHLSLAAPPSGAAARPAPDQAVAYLTTVTPQALTPEAARGAAGRGTAVPPRGALRLVTLESGSAVLLYGDHDDEVYPAVAQVPGAALVLAPSAGLGPQGFGAVLAQARGGLAHAVPLGPGDRRHLQAPFAGASVAVQP